MPAEALDMSPRSIPRGGEAREPVAFGVANVPANTPVKPKAVRHLTARGAMKWLATLICMVDKIIIPRSLLLPKLRSLMRAPDNSAISCPLMRLTPHGNPTRESNGYRRIGVFDLIQEV